MKHQFKLTKDKENVIIIPSFSNVPMMPNFPADISRITALKKIGLCIYIHAALLNARIEVTNTVSNQTIDFKKDVNAYSFWISIDGQDKIVIDVILNNTGDEVESFYCSNIATNRIMSPKTVEDLTDYLFTVFAENLRQAKAV